MDYLKSYKSFINSHYFNEGIRITSGVLLPAGLMSYFDMFSTGILISLGALFVSVTDSAGPVHHRKNGMIICIAAIFLETLVAGFFLNSPVLLALFILISCFFFSMIGIYGARAASIGTATLIVLTLSLDDRLHLSTPLQHLQRVLFITAGGLWYIGFSLALYTFRPYRLAQQALGDYLQSIAEYLLNRAELYNKEANYDSVFRQLQQQQVIVQNKQTELSELLFKTRDIVKETTVAGRTLVMIYLDAADIFERIMMSYQEYAQLHKFFDETGILENYYILAKQLAEKLDEIGIAVKSGKAYFSESNLSKEIFNATEKLSKLRVSHLKPDNIEGFISLAHILENIKDLSNSLNTLSKYTRYNSNSKKQIAKSTEHEETVSSREISVAVFRDNLTLKSDTFRHSARVSIAMIAGFLLTQIFKIGHSYWILLTIVVILKPAFSLTKKRNRDRIAGTITGMCIGGIILFTIQNSNVLLVLLILFMAGSYTFMRTNYFINVSLMTPYLLLFYHLLNPLDFKVLVADRLADTLIGSSIAFFASIFLFPLWEREKILPVMSVMLTDAKAYFSVVARAFGVETIIPVQEKTARKNALVALANLTDAFNRMLSEPKSQQKGIESVHQFVVLNHTFTSYIAALSHYIHIQIITDYSPDFSKVSEGIENFFSNAVARINNENASFSNITNRDSLKVLNDRANALLQIRRQELEQGLLETATRKQLFNLKSITDQLSLIYNVAADIDKTAQKLANAFAENDRH